MSKEDKYLVKVDRTTGAANVIELEPSWWQRMAQATQYVLRGNKAPDWFGPGAPLAPVAPNILEGRQFDYPVTANLNTKPGTGEAYPKVDFQMLRRFADTFDIGRLLIETRKDQLCKLDFEIGPRDTNLKPDARCTDIKRFLDKPDKEHDWDAWLRMILEDQIVIDAATVYPRLARDGSLYALEPVDGSTIKRIIDDYGRTPAAPNPAYQQFLKGLPAFNYTQEQLIYRPKNVRTHRIYGYSVIEQIIVTITLGLHRQAYQLQYYTEGSTPDLVMSCPPEWTPEMVAKFSEYWDSRLTGDTSGRRGTMFVFNGMDVVNTKESILTDKFDEWLARVACFAFGMSSQPFSYAVNRATAETAAEQAKSEGVGPVMKWVKNLMDFVIAEHMGAPDLQFLWKEEPDVDPKVAADIEDLRIKHGGMSINESREARGMEPVEGGDVPMIYTGTGAVPLAQVQAQAEASLAASEAIAEGGGALAPPPKGSAPARKQPNANTDKEEADGPSADFAKAVNLPARMAKVFAKLAKSVAKQIDERMAKVSASEIDSILAGLDLSDLGDLLTDFVKVLAPTYRSRFLSGAEQAKAEDLYNLAPTRATAYAASRAAELVGSGPRGGELGDATRLLIRGTIEKALDEGWTTAQLSDELQDAYGFSASRADVIADNEVQTSIVRGQYDAWKASGHVTGKSWLTSNDDNICDVCESNAAQGVIGIDEMFESGDDCPPAHPNCHCDLAPELGDEE